jgi:hypothetical protein
MFLHVQAKQMVPVLSCLHRHSYSQSMLRALLIRRCSLTLAAVGASKCGSYYSVGPNWTARLLPHKPHPVDPNRLDVAGILDRRDPNIHLLR